MNIGIIGAGFTGLSAAYRLLQKGQRVTVFEKDSQPGGLAIGFKIKDWSWTLEQHYHHWFTNDSHIINLAKELDYEVLTKRPKTSVYVEGDIFQLDSPVQVLKFPKLSIPQRIRMGIILGLLRYNPIWQPLERFRTVDILPKAMGEKPYNMLWRPLLQAKFGKYAEEVSLAWFWARISKRTSSLAYPYGGFLAFAEAIAKNIKSLGGSLLYDHEILELTEKGGKIKLQIKDKNGKQFDSEFDKVIVTLPSPFFIKIAPDLSPSYKKSLTALKGVGAINLILRMGEKFLKDNTYWLSICDKAPVLAIVEHTNYMDKKYYNNEHLVYLGNYLPYDHKYFSFIPKQLLDEYDQFLTKINPEYKKDIIDYHLFKTPFAQPVVPVNYSKMIPPFETSIKNVFLANIQQVYPWDRGTTYAVELGEKVAKIIQNSEFFNSN